METYNGNGIRFELAGAPDEQRRRMWMEHVEVAATDVLHMAAFMAQKFDLKDLHHDIVQNWQPK